LSQRLVTPESNHILPQTPNITRKHYNFAPSVLWIRCVFCREKLTDWNLIKKIPPKYIMKIAKGEIGYICSDCKERAKKELNYKSISKLNRLVRC
jgi:hypothetical protein